MKCPWTYCGEELSKLVRHTTHEEWAREGRKPRSYHRGGSIESVEDLEVKKT